MQACVGKTIYESVILPDGTVLTQACGGQANAIMGTMLSFTGDLPIQHMCSKPTEIPWNHVCSGPAGKQAPSEDNSLWFHREAMALSITAVVVTLAAEIQSLKSL